MGNRAQTWLDEISELVHALATRIQEHGGTLRGNEAATRYALIDPLLRGLGWDLSDPNQVLPEYYVKGMYLDYAMLHQDQPKLIVEAKKLGETLDSAAKQAGSYSYTVGAPYVVLTNGDDWKGFGLRGTTVPAFEFTVTDRSASVLELLWLWRGNFMGRPTQPKFHRGPDVPEAEVDPVVDMARLPSTPPSQSGVPLPEVAYVKGMPPPRLLIFPDGATKDVSRSWATVQVATAEWLFDAGKVIELPLANKQGTHLASRIPRRRDGKDFRQPKKIGPDLWIDLDLGPANHLRRAQEMLKACGISPETVRLAVS